MKYALLLISFPLFAQNDMNSVTIRAMTKTTEYNQALSVVKPYVKDFDYLAYSNILITGKVRYNQYIINYSNKNINLNYIIEY